MDINTEIPAGLRKTGIARVTDNVETTQRLAVSGGMIWAFFEHELKARFLRKHDAATDARSTPAP